MAEIWNNNEELSEDEELVVTDHRDAPASTESLDEEAPQEELPLEEFRALEDSDQQNVTTPVSDRAEQGEEEEPA